MLLHCKKKAKINSWNLEKIHIIDDVSSGPLGVQSRKRESKWSIVDELHSSQFPSTKKLFQWYLFKESRRGNISKDENIYEPFLSQLLCNFQLFSLFIQVIVIK